MKHIVCFSGGHSSALVAIEVVRKFGLADVVLLNHNISSKTEDADIKRFKTEIADYLELPITYANCLGIVEPERLPDQFDVCRIAKAFKVDNGSELCTNRLKTAPFYNWLASNVKPGEAIIYYGFDKKERDRMIRRTKLLATLGYRTAYPLADWRRTIRSTQEVDINPPLTYSKFKHANCIGCLKAGKQHWYVVYCTRKDIWGKAKEAEAYIGYTIHPGESLESLEPLFAAMQQAGIQPTEHIAHQRFWADVSRYVRPDVKFSRCQPSLFMPCDCVF